MTDIRKPVHRRTVSPNYMGRRIVVSIEPGDVLGFREERTRRTFRLPVSACWQFAVKLAVAADKAEKRRAK